MAFVSYFQQSRPEVLPHVPAGCRRVLEIGCSEGRFMEGLRAQRGDLYAVGVEPFADAAAQASKVFDRVIHAPVEAALLALEAERFDCVIANDVLEHLTDPWQVLRGVAALLAPGGWVVASIPNIRYWPVLNALFMQGRWEYEASGVLDRTHLRFFTRSSLPALFDQAGLHIAQCAGINPVILPWKIAVLNRLLGGRFDDTRFQQFVCVAQRKTQPGPESPSP